MPFPEFDFQALRSWLLRLLIARMHNWDQKGTVIFGRSGRAPKMTPEYSAYTPILFIFSV